MFKEFEEKISMGIFYAFMGWIIAITTVLLAKSDSEFMFC